MMLNSSWAGTCIDVLAITQCKLLTSACKSLHPSLSSELDHELHISALLACHAFAPLLVAAVLAYAYICCLHSWYPAVLSGLFIARHHCCIQDASLALSAPSVSLVMPDLH